MGMLIETTTLLLPYIITLNVTNAITMDTYHELVKGA
jgi:hypothetical protein